MKKIYVFLAILMLFIALPIFAANKQQEQDQALISSAQTQLQKIPNFQLATNQQGEQGLTVDAGDIKLKMTLGKCKNFIGQVADIPEVQNGRIVLVHELKWYGAYRQVQLIAASANDLKFGSATEVVHILDAPTEDIKVRHIYPEPSRYEVPVSKNNSWYDYQSMGYPVNNPGFYHIEEQHIWVDGDEVAVLYWIQTQHEIYLIGYVPYQVKKSTLTAEVKIN